MGPCCARCGRPFVSAIVLDREAAPLCGICQRGLYDFDFARGYTAYTETVAGALRSRPRPDKLRLTLRERWRSVRGVYTTRHGLRVDNPRVLLVDDVLTTGATLDACSRALGKAGAAKVVALTAARAIPWRGKGRD